MDRSIAGADMTPLRLNPQEGDQGRFVLGPDAIGAIVLVRLVDQAEATEIVLQLVSRLLAWPKLAGRPGAPGPGQFPRRALAIDSA